MAHRNPGMKVYLLEQRDRCFSRLSDTFGSYYTVDKKTVALPHEHISAHFPPNAATGIMNSMRFLVGVSAILFATAYLQLSL